VNCPYHPLSYYPSNNVFRIIQVTEELSMRHVHFIFSYYTFLHHVINPLNPSSYYIHHLL
jgi:hypothetical protein